MLKWQGRAFVGLLWLGSAIAALAAEAVGPKKPAAAARLEGKLTIDGKLDEPAWQKAPVQTGFENPLGQAGRKPIPEDQQTFFRVLYDDATLYVGIRCNEPKMGELRAEAARVHDAAMWSDDDVELFFDPVGDRMEYYQFAVNTDGTQCDLYFIERGNTGKGGWSTDWQAAVYKDKDFWSAEIAIPFGAFHNRPSRAWAENWAFSISRTRTPAPAYFSQFSQGNRYHDIANFGTLGPIQIDRSRFNLCAESPRFRLEPAEPGYQVAASLMVENRSDKEFEGKLAMEILAPTSRGASIPLKLAPKSRSRIELSGALVLEQGKWPILFRAEGAGGYRALVARFDDWLKYTPLTIQITQPNYRNSIYATQEVASIRGAVKLGMPVEKVKGLPLKVTLSSNVLPPISTEVKWEGEAPAEPSGIGRHTDPAERRLSRSFALPLPAAGLPEGCYVVRAELLRPIPNPKPDGPKFERIAEAETPLRKLPPAPSVEARVDDQGNLLINGKPIFVRGWYGSLGYCISAASFPQAQLPHSTNFVMGATQFEITDLGLYSLGGNNRDIDEAKARLDQPIDGELKAKIRAWVADVRQKRNIIGYYISDEPECRGLSPVFLKSLYEFLAEEDPYRFAMIVSRAPAEYIGACDVMCPHPYMNPQRFQDGTRKFGSYIREIRNTITEGVRANDGSKALWSMPQTFTYGGLHGQNPTFAESRWFVHTSIACGAKGIVPFIFCGFWNHMENRVAVNYVFEELTLLAPAWSARDTAIEAACDNPEIDVVARFYRPRPEDRGHAFLVAANQSYEPKKATFTVPALAKGKSPRLLVLRENRVVPVENGKFTDEFPGLGAHVYTTLEVLPSLRTLDEIQAEIAAALKRPKDDGNILASGKVRWAIGEFGTAFQSDSDLADGVRDAAGWFPVYGDRKQCLITFGKPITFSRVALDTPTIKAADLDVWVGGEWQTIHQWKDQYLYRLSYKGAAVTTDKIRIRPTEARLGYGSWLIHEITELGIYEK